MTNGDDFRRRVRAEVYERDIGQRGWLQADELDSVTAWLGAPPHGMLLDIGCGAPSIPLAEITDCGVVGLGIDPAGILRAAHSVDDRGMAHRIAYVVNDADRDLPFAGESFDGLLCFDLIDHLRDRAARFADWYRILKPGGRVVVTDPVVITGAVSNEELHARAHAYFHLFVPPGYTEEALAEAGFNLVRTEDLTAMMAQFAAKQVEARTRNRELFEGEDQALSVYEAVARMAGEGRLSRFAYVAERKECSDVS